MSYLQYVQCDYPIRTKHITISFEIELTMKIVFTSALIAFILLTIDWILSLCRITTPRLNKCSNFGCSCSSVRPQIQFKAGNYVVGRNINTLNLEIMNMQYMYPNCFCSNSNLYITITINYEYNKTSIIWVLANILLDI